MKRILFSLALTASVLIPWLVRADRLLVEAESFQNPGGWSLDTQFIEIMGSPYLLAHGLGEPVNDASTTVTFPSIGTYRVFIRTKDWVARWNAPGSPGRFQLLVDGRPLHETFGTRGADWFWHDGGTVEIEKRETTLALRDLSGFDGRCDAILFSKDPTFVPPNDTVPLAAWRKQLLGLPAEPESAGEFDLVVVGGGYAGMASAISAARMGLKVALIQNRSVLGGNGSSEIRVWSQGLIRRGKYPHIGEMVQEFADNAKSSPGNADEFGDELKETVVRAEKNISLFFNQHAYKVEMQSGRIAAVIALDTRTSRELRFTGKFFVDCTGHGSVGFLAGADYDVHDDVLMGMSNMWRWTQTDQRRTFPEIEWALDLGMDDFPYPKRFHGEWFWESGFKKDPIKDLEYIRDWNLRAVFGAWNAMKNKEGRDEHANAKLEWIAYIGGTRESRRLMGDVILSRQDIVEKREFPDGCVPTTWSIDLHYPKKQYMEKYPDDPFISVADHGAGVDRNYGYPVPYRSFYSRNIPNLFMAGRCISVTHEALGTVRVMRTCGMMGEVVGKAASICVKQSCTPRDIYNSYWHELDKLLQLPGHARRETLDGAIDIQGDALPLPVSGISASTLPGLVIDDTQAKRQGNWTEGRGLKGYVGDSYLYHSHTGTASIRYEFTVPKSGQYEVRVAYGAHENRASNTPVAVLSAEGQKSVRIDQRLDPPLKGFISLGTFQFEAGARGAVVISNNQVDGFVHADAVQILPLD